MNMSQYRDLFVSEARRHLETFASLIIQLENSKDTDEIHELFRHAHSLKGMAATMQFEPIAVLAHRLEDLMARVRDGQIPTDAGLCDILLEGCDRLGSMVSLVEAGEEPSFPEADDLISRITDFRPDHEQPSSPPPNLHQFRHSDSFTSVRVKTETLDRLVTITGELITTQHRLADRCGTASIPAIGETLNQLSQQLRELRDEVFLARMLPFSVVSERFPRLVRDLGRERNREVRLQISGGEIELDRGVLEAIAEPLVHLLRNAVDHGLEEPGERASMGKDPSGLVSLSVSRDRDQVIIAVADDGRGMDPAALKARAVDRGILTPEQAANLTSEEALMLVCAPGFSTAERVTSVSGRGVGMDAVRSAVRGLGGNLSIQSAPSLGSCFRLTLPLTVSIIHVLLAECGPLTVAFPVSTVSRTLELTRDEIIQQDGDRFCKINGTTIPLLDLHQLLGFPSPPGTPRYIPVIVSEVGGKTIGLEVSAIVGQREVFVKPLGKPFSHLRHSSAGAILGNGRIVFVLDVSTIA